MNSEAQTLAPKSPSKPLTEEVAKKLLEAGVHFGHPVSKRSPRMDEFVFGVAKNGIQIIDLDLAWKHLQKAASLLKKLTSEDKNILFVGTNEKAISTVLEDFAEKHKLNFVTSRWLGGTLTNPVTRNRINYLRELEGMEKSGLLDSVSAKEKSFLSKKLKKLRKNLGGLKNIKGAIHAIVIVDPMSEVNATFEAFKKSDNMNIIVITDTDCKFPPEDFDVVVPCNVSSKSSLSEVMDVLVGAMEEGRQEVSAKRASSMIARKKPIQGGGSSITQGPRRTAPAGTQSSAQPDLAKEVKETKE